MQQLLSQALRQWHALPHQHTFCRYVEHLLQAFPAPYIGYRVQCPNPQLTDQLAEHLSVREREVLPLLAAGLSHREIAAALTIAPDTARTYIKNIYGKLQVQNRVQAVARARELELVH